MSKTYKMYYDCAYQVDFEAKILDILDTDSLFHIALDRSCFYPGGGGQPSDKGWLNDAVLLDCYSKDGYIYHVLSSPPKSEIVSGRVDFCRRYAFMQNHSGEHILSGLAKSNFGAENVGFHMSSRGFTMDLDTPISKEDIYYLEQLANEAVALGLEIRQNIILGEDTKSLDFRSKRSFSPDEQVRLTDIPGYDLCACAGLHVKNTLEIGIIKIVSHQKYKGGVRLEVFCGGDAYWDYSRKNTICSEAGALLSSDTDSIIPALDKLISNKSALGKKLGQMQNKIFELRAANVENGCILAYFFEDDIDSRDMCRFAALIAQRAKIAVVLSDSDSDEAYKYAICSENKEILAEFVEAFNLALNGKGGMSGEMANGLVRADYKRITAFLESNLEGRLRVNEKH
jgi:alanyl-tRNA synthetase